MYVTFGFPVEDSDSFSIPLEVHSKTRSVTADLYGFSEGDPKLYDPKLNVVLDVERLVGTNRQPLPSLDHVGMSGGGIWHFSAGDAAESLAQDKARLVGVVHTHRKQLRVFVGTQIWVALQFIHRNFPSTRNEIKRWCPIGQ